MKTLQVRNLPEEAHRRLKARAALRGQSLSEFARTELATAVERELLEADVIHVPHLWLIEVAQVLRRHVGRGQLSSRRGAQLLEFAADLPAHRHPHEPLAPRIWALRDDLTAHDATYIALSEALDARLVTTHSALARAPAHTATVQLIA